MNDLSDAHTSISHASIDSSMSDMRRILDGVQQFPPSSSSEDGRRDGRGGGTIGGTRAEGGGGGDGYHPPVPEDEEDFSVLRYGSNCVLKSRQVLLTGLCHMTSLSLSTHPLLIVIISPQISPNITEFFCVSCALYLSGSLPVCSAHQYRPLAHERARP